MQLTSSVAILVCSALLASCGTAKEPAEVAFRHCLLKQARVAAQVAVPTYEEAQLFARNCDSLARDAATDRTRQQVPGAGGQTWRENYEMIVSAHVCAIARDPHHCRPLE